MRRIYMDHAATTPVHPEVTEAMLPYLGERFGNPSSIYSEGREARKALEAAMRRAAEIPWPVTSPTATAIFKPFSRGTSMKSKKSPPVSLQ